MRNQKNRFRFFVLILGSAAFAAHAHLGVKASPNGLKIPHNYWDWQLIASSHRADNNSLRVILGNDTAIEAVREGSTNPWPDGAILAKLVWEQRQDESWPTATFPGTFLHTDFMYKDGAKFVNTGGWGWARWEGMEQIPYGEDSGFSRECIECHSRVQANDHVFTIPAELPY